MFQEEKKLNTGYTCEKLLMVLGQLCTGFREEGGVETNLMQSDHRVETGSSCYGSNSVSHGRAIMLWLPLFSSLSRSILPPNKLLMHQPHHGRMNCNTGLIIILNQVQMALCFFWLGESLGIRPTIKLISPWFFSWRIISRLVTNLSREKKVTHTWVTELLPFPFCFSKPQHCAVFLQSPLNLCSLPVEIIENAWLFSGKE